MRIEEVVPYLQGICEVDEYHESPYGIWVFYVTLQDHSFQVRIRKFPRTKIKECFIAIAEAIHLEMQELHRVNQEELEYYGQDNRNE